MLLLVLVSIAVYVPVSRQERNPVARGTVIALLVFAVITSINAVRILYLPQLAFGRLITSPPAIKLIFGILAVLLAAALYSLRKRLAAHTGTVLVILSPVILVVFVNGTLAITQLRPVGAGWISADYSMHPTRRVNSFANRRAMIFVFDAWDFEETFEPEDPTVELPEINRLTADSILLRSASFGENTLVAIPSLITGREIVTEEAVRGIDLRIGDANPEQSSLFSRNKTIFHDVFALGGNSAAVGVGVHPLCLLFRDVISSCRGLGYWPSRTNESVLTRIDDVLVLIGLQFPGAALLRPIMEPKLHANPFADNYLSDMEAIERALTDSSFQFVYAHLLLPHGPFFYDRFKNDFVMPSAVPDGYRDALELVDRSIGRLRRNLEKSGAWETSMVIFTADHGGDSGDMPIIIHWPGFEEAIWPGQRVQPYAIASLVREFLGGEVIDPDQAIRKFRLIEPDQ